MLSATLRVVIVSSLSFSCQKNAPPDGGPSMDATIASIAAVKVERGDIEQTLDTYGKVEFATSQQRNVTFVHPGQVMTVPVVEGQMVRASDELLRVGAVPSGSPEVQQAAISVKFAERELVRVQRLVDERLATNQDLQSAEKQLAVANAALSAFAGGGATGTPIRASMDGIVAQVLVHRGDVVQAGQTAIILAPRESMSVRAGFEVEDIALLSEGLAVRISSPYGQATDKAADATLSSLHRTVDPKTQLVEGVIRVSDPPTWMAPGLSVHVVIVLETHKKVLCVPRGALVQRNGATGTFVIVSGHASWRVLELGLNGGDSMEVRSGLQEGDSVATTGKTTLSDGMAVRLGATDQP